LATKTSWSPAASSAYPSISCGSAVVAGVRIDGDHLDALRCGGGEHHGRLATEAPDLDDRGAGGASSGCDEQAPALVGLIHPSSASTRSAMSS
jgi:hypothetical protein